MQRSSRATPKSRPRFHSSSSYSGAFGAVVAHRSAKILGLHLCDIHDTPFLDNLHSHLNAKLAATSLEGHELALQALEGCVLIMASVTTFDSNGVAKVREWRIEEEDIMAALPSHLRKKVTSVLECTGDTTSPAALAPVVSVRPSALPAARASTTLDLTVTVPSPSPTAAAQLLQDWDVLVVSLARGVRIEPTGAVHAETGPDGSSVRLCVDLPSQPEGDCIQVGLTRRIRSSISAASQPLGGGPFVSNMVDLACVPSACWAHVQDSSPDLALDLSRVLRLLISGSCDVGSTAVHVRKILTNIVNYTRECEFQALSRWVERDLLDR